MGDDAQKMLAELCAEFGAARVRAGLTSAELAEAAGASHQFVEAIESGYHGDLGSCVAIAAVLGLRLTLAEHAGGAPAAMPDQWPDDSRDGDAVVLRLPIRNRGRDGDGDDVDGLPGVW